MDLLTYLARRIATRRWSAMTSRRSTGRWARWPRRPRHGRQLPGRRHRVLHGCSSPQSAWHQTSARRSSMRHVRWEGDQALAGEAAQDHLPARVLGEQRAQFGACVVDGARGGERADAGEAQVRLAWEELRARDRTCAVRRSGRRPSARRHHVRRRRRRRPRRGAWRARRAGRRCARRAGRRRCRTRARLARCPRPRRSRPTSRRGRRRRQPARRGSGGQQPPGERTAGGTRSPRHRRPHIGGAHHVRLHRARLAEEVPSVVDAQLARVRRDRAVGGDDPDLAQHRHRVGGDRRGEGVGSRRTASPARRGTSGRRRAHRRPASRPPRSRGAPTERRRRR